MTFATGEAQLKPGSLALGDPPLASQNVWVLLEMDEDPEHPVRFGMTGSAAVYAATAKPFQIIRKIMLRMQSLKDFLF